MVYSECDGIARPPLVVGIASYLQTAIWPQGALKMPVHRQTIRPFPAFLHVVRSTIWGGLFLLFLPVFGLAQTLTLEMSRGPLEDGRLREAIALSTDWMRAAERTGLNIRGVIIRHADEMETKRRTPQDIRKAKSLLAEMGGVSRNTQLIVFFDPQRTQKLAQLAAANMRSLGLAPRLVPLPNEARAEMQRMMRTRSDISDLEPGFIMLTWSFAEMLTPFPRVPEIVPPDRVRPDNLTPVTLPDLVVSEFRVDFDPRTKILSAKALVRNAGQKEVPVRFAVTFPDSAGVIRDQLGRSVAGPLGPGQAQWVEAAVRVNDAALGQTVRLHAVADAALTIHETNERNNNSVERSVYLERPTPPPLDLAVARFDPTYDPLSRRLTLQVTVRNVGGSPAGPSSLQVFETQRLFPIPAISISAIAPGDHAIGVAKIIVPETALGKVAQLEAVANADKKLREVNFNNNSFGPVRIRLEPPPEPERADLALVAFKARYDPASQEIAVSLAVRNEGRGNSGPFEVGVFDHTGFINATTLRSEGLASGQSTSRSLRIPVQAVTTARTIVLQAEADPGDRVRESNTDNNFSPQIRLLLEPPPKPEQPDLQIARLFAEYDPVRNHIVLRAGVVNSGLAPSEATRVRFSELDGQVPATNIALQALVPGRSIIVQSEAPLAPSPESRLMNFVAWVDVDRRVDESREDNNESHVATLRIPASAAQLPDLVVRSLAIAQTQAGAPISVTAEIVNTGGSGSAATDLELIVAGAGPIIRPLPALGPNESYTLGLEVPVRVTLFDDTVEVSLEADPAGRNTEVTKANNLRRAQGALHAARWPWIALFGGGLAGLLMISRLLSRLGRGRPDSKSKIPPHLVRLQPSVHAGQQVVTPEPGKPGIEFELSLRPKIDSGNVAVEPLADTGDPDS